MGGPRKCLMVEEVIDGNILKNVSSSTISTCIDVIEGNILKRISSSTISTCIDINIDLMWSTEIFWRFFDHNNSPNCCPPTITTCIDAWWWRRWSMGIFCRIFLIQSSHTFLTIDLRIATFWQSLGWTFILSRADGFKMVWWSTEISIPTFKQKPTNISTGVNWWPCSSDKE